MALPENLTTGSTDHIGDHNEIHNLLNLSRTLGTNSQAGTSYTVVLDDRQRPVELTSGSLVTVTIPAGVFAAGDVLPEITRIGAGAVMLAQGSGMTLRSPTGSLVLRAQWSAVSLRFRSSTEAIVAGDLQ